MKKIIIPFLIGLSISSSFAQGSHTGGGDQCKNEIDKHRQEILAWIERDEASELDFTKAKIAGMTYLGSGAGLSYKKRMLAVLQEGKVIVNCYLDPARMNDDEAKTIAHNEGVSYRTVSIQGQPSTCINYEDAMSVSHIDCNYDLVMNENSIGHPNYRNTHHEFASIAGIEIRASAPSDMSVSDQLSEFEQIVLVKKLGPKTKKIAPRKNTPVTRLEIEVDGINGEESRKNRDESKSHRALRHDLESAIQGSSELLETASSCSAPIALSFKIRSAGQFNEERDNFGRNRLGYLKPSIFLFQNGQVVSRSSAQNQSIESLLQAAQEAVSNFCIESETLSSGIQFKFQVLSSSERATVIEKISHSSALKDFKAKHACIPLLEFKNAINSMTKYCDINGRNCEIVSNTELVLSCGSISRRTEARDLGVGVNQAIELLSQPDSN